MRILSDLLANNQAWAAAMIQREPDFFARLSGQQAALSYLWIGCSDSRVPANHRLSNFCCPARCLSIGMSQTWSFILT